MNTSFLGTILIASLACLGGCASAPPMPVTAAMLSDAELGLTPGVIHSDVIEVIGEPVIASDSVAVGGTLASAHYRYKHTAVLTEDVTGFSFTVSGVQAPKGSPGYYAGRFMGPYSHGHASELWCFLPSIAGGRREHLCLLRSGGPLAAIAPTRLNPYLWYQFAPATGTFDFVGTPAFERREIEIPGDLVLEYRFNGWTNDAAQLEEFAVGRSVRRIPVQLDDRGIGVLNTVMGDITIQRDEADPTRARISLPRY